MRLGGGGGELLEAALCHGGRGGYKVPRAAWLVAGGVKG